MNWIIAHQAALIPLALLVVNDLKNALSKYPAADTWLGILSDLLSWHQNADSPGTLKMPGLRSNIPQTSRILSVPLDPPRGNVHLFMVFAIAILAMIAIIARPAKAQEWSAGLSLPMLEFQGGATHPVQFAPGAGAMVSVGFFQRALFGAQWDLLDVSATAFGTALSTTAGVTAGQLQVGLEVGTFNNILAVGVATPLYGPDGIGVFQGSFKAFPLLTINLPISLAPYSPPTNVYNGAAGLPRGGTLYLLAPKPAL